MTAQQTVDARPKIDGSSLLCSRGRCAGEVGRMEYEFLADKQHRSPAERIAAIEDAERFANPDTDGTLRWSIRQAIG